MRYFFPLLIATVVLSACSKNEAPPIQPEVTAKSFQFSPSIGIAGTTMLIYVVDLPTDTNAISVKIGSSTAVKPFFISTVAMKIKVPDDATSGKIEVTVKGKTVTSSDVFTVLETTTVAITDFTPKQARPGTNITISGSGFGNDASVVDINIGSSETIKPISVTPTAIVFQMAKSIPSGKIKVTRGKSTSTSTAEFKALPEENGLGLTITGYDSRIRLGSTVSISGSFGNVLDFITVSFGGTPAVKATYLSSSGLTVQAVVPRYAKEGKITVMVEGTTLVGNVNYTFDTSVSDFTPKSAGVGDTIKFTGYGFTSIDDMAVFFNQNSNNYVRPIKVTPTEMLAVVPSNAVSGFLSVSAKLGTITDLISSSDNSLKFTVLPPVSFTNTYLPNSAKIGDVVRLNGNFSGADITKIRVSFGGSNPVQPASISGSDIYVKIPNDAKTGKITVAREGYKSFTGSFVLNIVP